MRIAAFSIVFLSGCLVTLLTRSAAQPWLDARAAELRREQAEDEVGPDTRLMERLAERVPIPESSAPFVARGRRASSGFVPARGGSWGLTALPFSRIALREARTGRALSNDVREELLSRLIEFEEEARRIEAAQVTRENELVDAWLTDATSREVFYFVGEDRVFVLSEGQDEEYDRLRREHEGVSNAAKAAIDAAFRNAQR